MLGISVRTLHYWEERGLASPSFRTAADYRIYSDADVRLLQQVIVYQATGMSLDNISTILRKKRSDVDVLRHQRRSLMKKQADMNEMIRAIDTLLEDAMSTENLSTETIAKILGDAKFPEYQS